MKPCVLTAAFSIFLFTACAVQAAGPASLPITSQPKAMTEITYNGLNGKAPFTASFNASPVNQTYRWLVNDEEAARGASFSRTFYQAGEYTVRLEFASGPARGSWLGTVVVQDGGVARATATILPESGELVRLLGARSFTGSPASSYTWTFDDGQVLRGPDVTRALAPGKHAVTLAVDAPKVYEFKTYTLQAAVLSQTRSLEDRVVSLSNLARAAGWDCSGLRNGGPALPVLARDAKLDLAAKYQANLLALYGYFDHASPLDGSTLTDRVAAAGFAFRFVAENIAKGQPTPESVVDGWLHSPGHCHNLMSRDAQRIGVAAVSAGNVLHWVQVFGAPLNP